SMRRFYSGSTVGLCSVATANCVATVRSGLPDEPYYRIRHSRSALIFASDHIRCVSLSHLQFGTHHVCRRSNERPLIRTRLVEHKRKSTTGFQNGVDTDQAVLDSIALRQLLRRRILVDVGCEALKWSSILFGHRHGMILHAFG